jgi:hypothetical protein
LKLRKQAKIFERKMMWLHREQVADLNFAAKEVKVKVKLSL